MMEILLNGSPYQLSENSTIATLITQLDLTKKRLAVEINKEIVPRSQFDTYILAAHHHVEIIHAVGGG